MAEKHMQLLSTQRLFYCMLYLEYIHQSCSDFGLGKPVIYHVWISPFNHLLSENGVHVVCLGVCV